MGQVAPIVRETAASHGTALEPAIRTAAEERFGDGLDLSNVRVHFDPRAAEAARAANARAYTVGNDIVFGERRYSPQSSRGQQLLAHELGHVVQQRLGMVPAGSVQLDETEVTLIEVSQAESDLLFNDSGIKLPGSPPRVKFGNDGAIPAADQRAVQLAFDLAYATASTPTFAAKLGAYKQRMGKTGEAALPGLADLSQQRYLDALGRMTIQLADTTTNTAVANWVRGESQEHEKLPVAGFTMIGGGNTYIRAFALKEGRDALASLILHESAHIAGLPSKPINEFAETILEASIHQFESSVGLPLSQIVERAASIKAVKPHGAGFEFTASVTKVDNLPSDDVHVEVLDGNRRRVFFYREFPKKRFTKSFVWDGRDGQRPTESGIHSIRILAGDVLISAHDYIVRRS